MADEFWSKPKGHKLRIGVKHNGRIRHNYRCALRMKSELSSESNPGCDLTRHRSIEPVYAFAAGSLIGIPAEDIHPALGKSGTCEYKHYCNTHYYASSHVKSPLLG